MPQVLDLLLAKLPVRAWRATMAVVEGPQARRFARHRVHGVVRTADVDYVGDATPAHRLDVLRPARAHGPLPVYVYFHGGGWTSGDKAASATYCACQAAAGLVVVNANYRLATAPGPDRMGAMLDDANRVLGWVRRSAAAFGGDPTRIVVGGDSAGGQIAALVVATTTRPELAARFALVPAVPRHHLRGVVQHCSFADASLALAPWSVLSGFLRLLLPVGARRLRGPALAEAARFLSPVEWVSPAFPPVFVTSSARDFLHRASVALVERLHRVGVPVDSVVLGRAHRGARHTWQQDAGLPESQHVYRRLQRFITRVTASRPA